MRYDELYLWFLGNPSTPRYVGQLRLIDAGNGVSLQYGADWIDKGFPLSEDLPLTDIEHLPRWSKMAVGAVDDARPDRWGERVIQYIVKPERLSIMEYLYFAGDDRYGALGVSTSSASYIPCAKCPLPRLEQAQQLSEIAHKISAKEPITEVERQMLNAGGSFGGAKPKGLIEIAGGQWVIKFFDGEPIDVPLVEHASMTLAKLAGITVADTQIIPLVGENALAVNRYDRDGNKRIHCISAGTALRAQTVSGQEPDLGYPNLAQLLRRAGVAGEDRNFHDMQELFRRMVFNILIDNTDDHEKNHSLQVIAPRQQGRYRLTPAYDILPANSGQGHQEFIVGTDQRDSTLTNAMSQCELFGLTPTQAASEVLRVIKVVNGWRDHFARCGITESDLNTLAERIDGDRLLNERTQFDPTQYPIPRNKRRRRPFA